MTAFARHALTSVAGDDLRELTSAVWELRSVNHRFFEIVLRLPDACRDLEAPLRAMARERFARGRIEASLRLAEAPSPRVLRINDVALGSLIDALGKLRARDTSLAAPSALEVLRWPGVLVDAAADQSQLGARLQASFGKACDELLGSRRREGDALRDALELRLLQVADLVTRARGIAELAPQQLAARLSARLRELAVDVEPARLAQEVALLAQRADVAEELDRLAAHVDEFRRAFERTTPIGRHLDFLAQELGREANTLANKATDTALIGIAIDLKVAIEQIREQVQNVE